MEEQERCYDLLVPIISILSRSSQFIPQAHTYDCGNSLEKGGHLGEAQYPLIWIEEIVIEEAIAVCVTATPSWPGQVVVQNHHHTVVSNTLHHCLKSLDEGKINDGGVVRLHSGDGFKEAQLLKRGSNGERTQRIVGHQKSGPSEPHAVEAHGLYFLRYGIDGPFAQPFRHHNFQVGNPIHTRQLHPSPISAHDPSGIRLKKARHGLCGINIFHCSSGEQECRDYYHRQKENGENHHPPPPTTTYFHFI
ncbi:hypothetical protein V8G54_003584 [Vigna mungo]|uniref:Uncharacterized protein n=1 Tax=Vigna mungo TaxID=3915 RepID=A0AAQ3PDW1_VIGMU